MTERDRERLLRKLCVGLVLAIVLNVLLIVYLASAGVAWAGNAAAIVVCSMALWIVRNRDRFRGEG